MKKRPDGFLANDKIAHDSEVFDYLQELHLILWEFCRYFRPGCGGSLSAWLDTVLADIRLGSAKADERKLDLVLESQGRLAAQLDQITERLPNKLIGEYFDRLETKLDAGLKGVSNGVSLGFADMLKAQNELRKDVGTQMLMESLRTAKIRSRCAREKEADNLAPKKKRRKKR
jgi:hypothetical protein